MRKVLFICIHNSARSQMAEALLREICGHEFDVQSAGLEKGVINPLAVAAMAEVGIDISYKETQAVFDVFRAGGLFSHVITVCSEAESEGRACPIFPGVTKRLYWPFPDPSSFTGTWEEKLERTREVRDLIKAQIEEWCDEVCESDASVA